METYTSKENLRRVADGQRAISLHADYESGGITMETAACDMVANILHAVHAALSDDDVAAGGEFDPQGFLDWALRTYSGDFEDEPDDEQRKEHRETLRGMSDQAIAHQVTHGARGGTQRAEILREARRRGLVAP